MSINFLTNAVMNLLLHSCNPPIQLCCVKLDFFVYHLKYKISIFFKILIRHFYSKGKRYIQIKSFVYILSNSILESYSGQTLKMCTSMYTQHRKKVHSNAICFNMRIVTSSFEFTLSYFRDAEVLYFNVQPFSFLKPEQKNKYFIKKFS